MSHTTEQNETRITLNREWSSTSHWFLRQVALLACPIYSIEFDLDADAGRSLGSLARAQRTCCLNPSSDARLCFTTHTSLTSLPGASFLLTPSTS